MNELLTIIVSVIGTGIVGTILAFVINLRKQKSDDNMGNVKIAFEVRDAIAKDLDKMREYADGESAKRRANEIEITKLSSRVTLLELRLQEKDEIILAKELLISRLQEQIKALKGETNANI